MPSGILQQFLFFLRPSLSPPAGDLGGLHIQHWHHFCNHSILLSLKSPLEEFRQVRVLSADYAVGYRFFWRRLTQMFFCLLIIQINTDVFLSTDYADFHRLRQTIYENLCKSV